MTKILVVEDTEFFQKLYKDELEKAGFEVEIASDGEEGVAKMQASKPSLVFMDIVMPKMDGMEALAKIKADDSIKSIPVVMLTSMSAETKGEDSLMKGAVAYLVKNQVGSTDIVSKAEEILGTSKAPLNPNQS
jgi:CheY-like chemotaxis protein